MSSKFNMKSIRQPKQTWEWSSKPFKEDKEETKRNNEYKQALLSKKLSIESKHLQEVSFKDLYTFPFKNSGYSQVYDNDGNFIFQFEIDNKETRQKCLDIINDDLIPTKENTFLHDGGVIYLVKDSDRIPLILVRGWGNLTGSGAYNLNGDYACKIQDTLAEYIVEKLTNK